MKECEKLPKYPRFANLAWSVLALHVPAQNRNIFILLLTLFLYIRWIDFTYLNPFYILKW
jgi:hypothetical protein